jgi:hypothetical protein
VAADHQGVHIGATTTERRDRGKRWERSIAEKFRERMLQSAVAAVYDENVHSLFDQKRQSFSNVLIPFRFDVRDIGVSFEKR